MKWSESHDVLPYLEHTMAWTKAEAGEAKIEGFALVQLW